LQGISTKKKNLNSKHKFFIKNLYTKRMILLMY